MTTRIDSQVQIRLNKELKEKATILFDQLGMSLSEAIQNFSDSSCSRTGDAFQSTYSKQNNNRIFQRA